MRKHWSRTIATMMASILLSSTCGFAIANTEKVQVAEPVSAMLYGENQLVVYFDGDVIPDHAADDGFYRVTRKFGDTKGFEIDHVRVIANIAVITLKDDLKTGQYYQVTIDDDVAGDQQRFTVLGYDKEFLKKPLMAVMAEQIDTQTVQVTFDKVLRTTQVEQLKFSVETAAKEQVAIQEVEVKENLANITFEAPLEKDVSYTVRFSGVELFGRKQQPFVAKAADAFDQQYDFYDVDNVEVENEGVEASTMESASTINSWKVQVAFNENVSDGLEGNENAFVLRYYYGHKSEVEVTDVDVQGKYVTLTLGEPLKDATLYYVRARSNDDGIAGGVEFVSNMGSSDKETVEDTASHEIIDFDVIMKAPKEVSVIFEEDLDEKELKDKNNYTIRRRYGSKRSIKVKSVKVKGRTVTLRTEDFPASSVLYNLTLDSNLTGEQEQKDTFVSLSSASVVDYDEAEMIAGDVIEVSISGQIDMDEAMKKSNYTVQEKYGDKIEYEIDKIKWKNNRVYIYLEESPRDSILIVVKVDDNVNGRGFEDTIVGQGRKDAQSVIDEKLGEGYELIETFTL